MFNVGFRSLALGCLFASCLFGQAGGRASIVGAVTDQTNSVIVGAEVTATNVNTRVETSSTTTAAGTYLLPNLNPGPYELTIQSEGFKTLVRGGIVLRTSEQPRVDVQLELGSVTESIEVTAAPPLLETETSASGQIIEGDTIVKMPILQKAMYRMVLYMPDLNVMAGQHAVGQRERAMGYTLDGVSGKQAVAAQQGLTSITASLDSIQEFKMWTTGLPAEMGHGSGGQLAGVFKSGTNQLHGSVEDRHLNIELFHRGYFDQLDHGRNFTYHEASATLGGPIIRNKTFFFLGYQIHYENDTDTFTGEVPSPEMYQGDFSFGGVGNPIYDPATTAQDASGNWLRTPFANNQIPQSRFDPVANAVLANDPWRPQSTQGVLTATGPDSNLVRSSVGFHNIRRYDIKIDHVFNSAHRIAGRYTRLPRKSNCYCSETVIWREASARQQLLNIQHNFVISDTYIFNPTTINETRIGGYRLVSGNTPLSFGLDYAGQLGIPNVPGTTFPQFAGNFYGLGPGGKDQYIPEDFTFQENLTKVTGKHTLKFGYEFIRTRANGVPEALPSGEYTMSGTELPFTPNTGHTFASFLLGSVGSAKFTVNTATWLPRWSSHAFYAQTDYKPTRTLTLNLGLRWQYESPFQTKNGQQSQFDPNAMDSLTGLRGAIVHSAEHLAKKTYNNFQPRLGVAWQFSDKTVFRSSFSVLHSDVWSRERNQNFQEYLGTASVQRDAGDPRPVFKLSEGPPDRDFNVASDGSVPFIGTNFSGRPVDWVDPNLRLPYVMNWSGGFQHQLGPGWLIDLNYKGAAGVGLLNYWNINVLPPDVSSDPVELEDIRQRYQDFRPYPQFGTIRHFSNYGHNTYHGATLRVERRFNQGFSLNAFYTRSKSINNGDNDRNANGVTFYNRSLDKARASHDITDRFVGWVTYELPLGKGKKWMNTGSVANAVLGGWEIVWTQTLQSGQPFTVGFAGSPNRYLPNIGSRPNQVLPNDQVKEDHVDVGPDRFPRAAQKKYLNLDGFEYPDSFELGTLGRNTLAGPGLIWAQASASKAFEFFERVKVTLRLDWQNAFKVPSYRNPNSTFNTTNSNNFGAFNGGNGSFSNVGTHRSHGIIVLRVQW